jgi:hypothetical protein
MLIEFACSNFRSFKDEARLSMLPVNAYKEHPDNMAPVRPAGTNASGVLSAAVLYGPNASGKTNLLRAMDYARDLVLGRISMQDGPFRQPFVSNAGAETAFSFSMIADGVRFNYEFAVGDAGVVREVLKAQPKGEKLVFERILSDDGSYKVKQGSTYSGISSKLKGFADNGLVLGLLSKFGIADCVSVYEWFANNLVIFSHEQPVDYGTLLRKLEGLAEDGFSKAISAVKSADLGITGAQLAVSELTDDERDSQRVATDKVKAIFEALTGKELYNTALSDRKITFQFQHEISGQRIGFGFEDESLGTVTMLNLAADFLDAIASGKTLVVDEIERSLHPLLLRNLVALFFDRELNGRNAQLIFTTNDLSLMAADFLRRDQFWFVDKEDETGASELYPLSAYAPRKDDNILNRYLYGAYGAVPFIEGVL